ncbi:MAG TPA: hypothetical protein VMG36_03610 [Thermoplasmata archaeon]|nr:hypothetical protein [Thermoplasmata archaeon]
MSAAAGGGKRPAIALTPSSKVRIRSAGPDETAIVSTGVFRGLVSIGGDNAIAIELDGSDGDEKGRIRLVPVPALLAVDIIESAKPEEEKRSEPASASAYFR